MTKTSQKTIDEILKEYSLHVEYWDADFGEGHLMRDVREALEERIQAMSRQQMLALNGIDQRAANLLVEYRGPATFDVKMLKAVVDLAHDSHVGHAA